MKNNIALLYTSHTCGEKKIASFKLLKKSFKPESYNRVERDNYVAALDAVSSDSLMIIDGTEVFGVFFSDGTIYDTTTGWRPYKDKEATMKHYTELAG